MTHDGSTLQFAIDAAFHSNGDKHGGTLVTSKCHIAWPREAPARLAVAKAFLAALPPAEQSALTSEPETFEAHGKTWTRHKPGDSCPVPGTTIVYVLTSKKGQTPASAAGCCGWQYTEKDNAWWGVIIGWRYADEPEPAQPWAPAAGDVVRLKSGGPQVTVKAITSDGLASCIWFDPNGQYHQLPVPVASLELVRKEKP